MKLFQKLGTYCQFEFQQHSGRNSGFPGGLRSALGISLPSVSDGVYVEISAWLEFSGI
jgi:hypothetical protein